MSAFWVLIPYAAFYHLASRILAGDESEKIGLWFYLKWGTIGLLILAALVVAVIIQ